MTSRTGRAVITKMKWGPSTTQQPCNYRHHRSHFSFSIPILQHTSVWVPPLLSSSQKSKKKWCRINWIPKMEGWFSTSSSPIEDQQKLGSSSLLADWNSYASSQQELQPSNSAISFDLESAVRSANNTVTGTFSV